jgi:hypothetical protein
VRLVAYIYCDYAASASQSTGRLVSSLLKQVVMQLNGLPYSIQESYKSHSKDSPLSLKDASNLLLELIADLESLSKNGRLFFLIEALDEHSCKDSSSLDFLGHIRSLIGQNSHIFVTSRPHLDVREHIPDCMKIDIHASTDDITTYIRSKFSDRSSFKKPVFKAINEREELKNKVLGKLVENSKGM